jgi:tetratricopeptide (TPR) repeat protein
MCRISVARIVAISILMGAAAAPAGAQSAHITEEVRTLSTYPFGEPNPIPILARDARLYPYHAFDGYTDTAVPRAWKVVKLENAWIEVYVLPEAGGKVWGAVVKATGHEFIYRNEVMKFRNIALRGPWTSGGIEFNFGVIGHTPATATPVDYRLVDNPDGSVSCWVGAMDLPSRTRWRVEIRLPADAATFETNAWWSNPTPLEQPYYNWMTGAAFARDDLEMTIPGDTYLEHSGRPHAWPVDDRGRDLARYRENTFGSHKSYHVVGELNDFFGGYYHDDEWGFGHWARYEDLPGQKLWLWALSREGGVWEDLLTDSDGQYVEFQAGRLFVQYSPGADVNPITQAGFDPGSSSRWTERWFPLEGTGGLSDASDRGALYAAVDGDRTQVGVNAFVAVTDTLEVWSGDERVAALPISLRPLEPFRTTVPVAQGSRLRVRVRALALDYDSDESARRLSRPFETDPEAFASMPGADRAVFQARELVKGREYARARPLFEAALGREPWNREALLGMADLEYRAGRYEEGLERVGRALQIDAYDARANFLAGIHHRALGHKADAHDALGWAARSTTYQTAAYTQLAGIMVGARSWEEAARYARFAIDHDRYAIPAWRALAVVGRVSGDPALAREASAQLADLDPLGHDALAEAYLAHPDEASAEALGGSLGGEYPDQTLLELALAYVDMGRPEDALTLLDVPTGRPLPAEARAWKAFLLHDPSFLEGAGSPAFQFPWRAESLPVLAWADEHADAWAWTDLRALNLWGVGRAEEAADLMTSMRDAPDYGPTYAARGLLLEATRDADPVPDLRRAVALDPDTRALHVSLIRALQDGGAWGASLDAIADARVHFPEDFDLALLETRTLLEEGRAAEAADILAEVRVLPSENARESHRLFAWAHTLLSLDALEGGDAERARNELTTALTWPESLGQGRPYEPDERLVRFLLGVAERRLGDDVGADEHFRYVVEATRAAGEGASPSRLDLLAAPARSVLSGEAHAPPPPPADADFQGLEGRLLRRALSLTIPR